MIYSLGCIDGVGDGILSLALTERLEILHDDFIELSTGKISLKGSLRQGIRNGRIDRLELCCREIGMIVNLFNLPHGHRFGHH